MKILVAGDFHSEIHEQAFYSAFKNLGEDVHHFSWHEYFKGYTIYASKSEPRQMSLPSIYYLLQNKYLFGPVIHRINKELIERCKKLKPDLVFIYRGTHIFPQTLKQIQQQGCRIFGYNNDDPFSGKPAGSFWRHYLNGLSFYDWIFAYRHKNIHDYYIRGIKNVSLLRSYYIKSRNYKLDRIPTDNYKSDVSFIGHYEKDNRDIYLKSVFENNINLKIYGAFWESSPFYEDFLRFQKADSIPYLSENYNLGLNSCKIALVFLSKINNDTYTRRCFEIPASKTFMLSEYTEDLASLFKERVEAEFFRSKEELVDKIKYYLNHDSQRLAIADAGYEKLIKVGHEVTDRVEQIINTYKEIKQKQ